MERARVKAIVSIPPHKLAKQHSWALKVWVVLNPISITHRKKTLRYISKRDGRYVILTQRSPVSYDVANLDRPDKSIGNTSRFSTKTVYRRKGTPIASLRIRGWPKKVMLFPVQVVTWKQRGGCETWFPRPKGRSAEPLMMAENTTGRNNWGLEEYDRTGPSVCFRLTRIFFAPQMKIDVQKNGLVSGSVLG
ncbi:hypothetical protein CEXT_166451 [Caerostris extrusa]|uniref:Uncharacterized protein n=1 Tax=Caerostris extrusa TaxID=172846 RepID=A0AAV4V6G4_CAEEX|nr:hypothetical protein CEXT_166451 [Caerostris extrusa]